MISDRMKQRPIIAAGRLNLAEAVALIEASDVYVGVDSGPMHIAAFAGTPVVAALRSHRPGKGGTVRGGASCDPPDGTRLSGLPQTLMLRSDMP